MTKNDKTTKGYSCVTYSEYARCVKANPPIADERLWRGPVPESAKEIVFKAFRDREDLVDVALPKDLTAIRLSAFINCTNLRSVTFPKTLKKVESWAFAGTSLAVIRYEGTIEEFDRIEFGGDWCGDCKPVVHCTDADINYSPPPRTIEE